MTSSKSILTMSTKTGKRQFLFQVLYVFLCLTLALVIAIIVWMVNGGPKESTTLFQNSDSDTLEMPEDICLVEPLVGDGYCDDEANHSGCDFDLDDCCQLESDRNECTNW